MKFLLVNLLTTVLGITSIFASDTPDTLNASPQHSNLQKMTKDTSVESAEAAPRKASKKSEEGNSHSISDVIEWPANESGEFSKHDAQLIEDFLTPPEIK